MSQSEGSAVQKQFGAYFTAGHSLFNFHVSYKDFVSSLYFNLLFNPGGVSFVDHFFLSDYFENEILERPPLKSWITAGLSEGLITTFVKPGFSGFYDQLQNQLSYGARGLPAHAQELAKHLDGVSFKHLETVERNYGKEFDSRFRSVVHSNAENFVSGFDSSEATDLFEFWESDLVKRLRQEGYERAKEITNNSGTTGLRLATLIEAAREITLGGSGGVSDSVGKLLSDLRSESQHQHLVAPMHRFFKIACDTFNSAMSACIKAPANSPKLDFDFVAIQNLGNNLDDSDGEDIEVIHERTQLPSIAMLQAVNSSMFLKCREHGQDFFDAYKAWQKDQTVGKSGHVVEKLRAYAEKICLEFSQSAQIEDYSIYIATQKKKRRSIGGHALGIGIGAAVGFTVEYSGIEYATGMGAMVGAIVPEIVSEGKAVVITNQLRKFDLARNIRTRSKIRISGADFTFSQ